MEANLAPYKPKYWFWTGLLLFIILHLVPAVNVSNHTQLNLLAVGVSVTSLKSLYRFTAGVALLLLNGKGSKK